MVAYRVGPEGATVFDAHGRVAALLTDGQVVVPGVVDAPGSLAAQYRDLERRKQQAAVKRPAEPARPSGRSV